MRNYKLNIAEYIIGIQSADDGLDLMPSTKFKNFISSSSKKGISIKVHSGSIELPSLSQCVFAAPYVEETETGLIERNPDFWSIWKHNEELFIKTVSPSGKRNSLLKFSLNSSGWDLYIDSEQKTIDPLEYPLDGLVLYYLAVIKGDIMIHASGVNHKGNGYIFSGISGKGKTTMAALWEEAGATVIHDDRLILRKTAEGWMMYNTPVYDNEIPAFSNIDKFFIIEHGPENRSALLKDSVAISAFMMNCIQHNWSHDLISGMLHSVSDLCNLIPVFKLSFKPDLSIIDYITVNE